MLADLAQVLDVRLPHQRCDALAVVGAIGAIDLRGDAQPAAGAARDLDRPVEPLLRRHATEEHQVVAAIGLEPV